MNKVYGCLGEYCIFDAYLLKRNLVQLHATFCGISGQNDINMVLVRPVIETPMDVIL